MLAVIHGIDVYRAVERTRRDRIDNVTHVGIAQTFPCFHVSISAPLLRSRIAVFLHPSLDCVKTHRVNVRYGGHLASRNLCDAMHSRSAAVTHSDYPHSYLLHWSNAETVHRRTPRAAANAAHGRPFAHASCRHGRNAHPRRASQELSSVLIHRFSFFHLFVMTEFSISQLIFQFP